MKPFQLPEHGFPIHFLRNCCFGKIQCHLERKGDLQCPSSPLPSTGDTTAALEFTISSLGAALPHFRAPHIIALKMQHTRDAPLTSSHRPPKTPRAPAWNRAAQLPLTFQRGRQSLGFQCPPSLMEGSLEKNWWISSMVISLIFTSMGPSAEWEKQRGVRNCCGPGAAPCCIPVLHPQHPSSFLQHQQKQLENAADVTPPSPQPSWLLLDAALHESPTYMRAQMQLGYPSTPPCMFPAD